MDGTQVTIVPVLEDIAIGDVLFSVDTIDVTFGDHRVGVEVNWPSTMEACAKFQTPVLMGCWLGFK